MYILRSGNKTVRKSGNKICVRKKRLYMLNIYTFTESDWENI